jgi:hypothetical protein
MSEETEKDQVLRVAEALRREVMPVLAPSLAYHVDLAQRLLQSYRMRERYRAARQEITHE